MTPPKSVQVGPHPYTIRLDKTRCEDLSVRGQADSDKLEILLSPSLPASMMRETMFHELLHAVLDVQGVTRGSKPLLDDDDEEHLVQGLAPLLLDTLRRNPDLTAFLTDGAD